MGLTLEFYTGDPHAIGYAVEVADFDALDESGIVKARADLSLHIQPKDMDTLSVEAAGLLGKRAVLFQQSLGDAVGGEESDHGAFLVSADWVAQIGTLQLNTAQELATRWFASMARQYDDPEMQVTPAVEEAVYSLISLCKSATETSTPVIHAWFL
jgi:hypothetical protein